MLKWLICKLWGHDFGDNKICPIHCKGEDGNQITKGGAKECRRCGKYIVVILL